ncbi:MAG: hypothetical protein U9R58_10195 [Chloroflexota bacterium]|nr:hypothetical protein [Chloroflexota bacterium]
MIGKNEACASGLIKIKEVFDHQFERWQITLPWDDLENRHAGSIHDRGWTINYRFGEQDGKEFLEYFASHRKTNDILNRIWDDGFEKLVGFCQEFYPLDDEDAKLACLENKRNFYQQVKRKGLD